MKFYLANNSSCDLQAAFASKTSKTLELNLTGYPTRAEGDTALFGKFKTALDGKLGGLKRSMSVSFNPVTPENPGGAGSGNLWRVTLKSALLEVIHAVLHHGNEDVSLQIGVELVGLPYDNYDGISGVEKRIRMDGFVPGKEDNRVVSHMAYVKEGVKIEPPPPFGAHPGNSVISWQLSIEVFGEDFICLSDVLSKSSEAFRQMLKNKEHCDFEITSEDGTVIPCHKNFLWPKSPVLSTMVNGTFEEARENKLTIADMSTRGINALLEYLYSDDVSQALAHCDVALELLKAADKYDLPFLWKAVATILAKRSDAWYDVNVALEVASFVAKCGQEESDGLMDKMIQVLSEKTGQLSDTSPSPAFSKLFTTPEARKLFKRSLEKGRYGGKGK